MVGLSEMFFSDALDRTPGSVRPSFIAATRVGVFSFAKSRSFATSGLVQGFPLFGVPLAISVLLEVSYAARLAGFATESTNLLGPDMKA